MYAPRLIFVSQIDFEFIKNWYKYFFGLDLNNDFTDWLLRMYELLGLKPNWKVGSINCCLFLNWIATKIYHQLIALKASLNPVCFVGCTYSPKHRNCEVFSVNLIQISVTQDQISWLNNGRTPKKSIFWLIQSCSPRTNSWKKNLA